MSGDMLYADSGANHRLHPDSDPPPKEFEVEVRVTARYFIICDEEVASSAEEARSYAEGLNDSDFLDAPNYEVDRVEVLDANEL